MASRKQHLAELRERAVAMVFELRAAPAFLEAVTSGKAGTYATSQSGRPAARITACPLPWQAWATCPPVGHGAGDTALPAIPGQIRQSGL